MASVSIKPRHFYGQLPGDPSIPDTPDGPSQMELDLALQGDDLIGAATSRPPAGEDGTAEFAGRPGDTVPGFRVVEVEPGRRLVLRGRHRFSNYALTFVLDGDHLRAQTHAAFPGVLGWLYRTAVIRSGGHRLVTRRLLRQVARAT